MSEKLSPEQLAKLDNRHTLLGSIGYTLLIGGIVTTTVLCVRTFAKKEFNFSSELENCTVQGSQDIYKDDDLAEMTLVPTEGYSLPHEIKVTSGNELLIKNEGYTYDYTTGKVSVKVKNHFVVYATATINNYKVTFIQLEGESEKARASVDVTHGETVSAPTLPPYTGHHVTDWCTDVACTTKYTFSDPVKNDLTLYARWAKDQFQVTFNANGGKFADGTTEDKVETVDYMDVPTGYADLVKDADDHYTYTFIGWSKSATGSVVPLEAVTANTTYYAVYVKTVNTYTVTLDANGGTFDHGFPTFDIGPKDYGTSWKDVTKPTPTLVGYDFVGWFTESVGGEEITDDYTFTKNDTVYAHWELHQYTLQLTFVNCDVTEDTGTVNSETFAKNFTMEDTLTGSYTITGEATHPHAAPKYVVVDGLEPDQYEYTYEEDVEGRITGHFTIKEGVTGIINDILVRNDGIKLYEINKAFTKINADFGAKKYYLPNQPARAVVTPAAEKVSVPFDSDTLVVTNPGSTKVDHLYERFSDDLAEITFYMPASDVTVTLTGVERHVVTWEATPDKAGSSCTVSGIEEYYHPNDDVEVTIQALDGYSLPDKSGISVTGVAASAITYTGYETGTATLKFKMPNADAKITISPKYNYFITGTDVTHCSITVDTTKIYHKGDSITLTVGADSGYSIPSDGLEVEVLNATNNSVLTRVKSASGKITFTYNNSWDCNLKLRAVIAKATFQLNGGTKWGDGSTGDKVVCVNGVNGGNIPTKPADPTRDTTTAYTYTFNGYSPAHGGKITSDVTYKAQWTETANYYIKDSSALLYNCSINYDSTHIYHANDPVELDVTAATGYVIPDGGLKVRILDASSSAAVDEITSTDGKISFNMPAHDIKLEARIAKATFTLDGAEGAKWADNTTEDKTVCVNGVGEGTVPTKPTDPTRAATAEYTYAFDGYDPVHGGKITSDVTYKAKWTETKVKYTVTFLTGLDSDTTFDTQEVEYGASPVDPTTTEKGKPADITEGDYVYTFTGWDKTITTVTEDEATHTYKAIYAQSAAKRKVIFKNGDTVLQESEVSIGELPVFKGALPTKTVDGHEFQFDSWDNDIVPVPSGTGDIVYNATFNMNLTATINCAEPYDVDGKSGKFVKILGEYSEGDEIVVEFDVGYPYDEEAPQILTATIDGEATTAYTFTEQSGVYHFKLIMAKTGEGTTAKIGNLVISIG